MSSGVIAASFVDGGVSVPTVTRLYLPSAGAAPVSPAFGSVWETVSQADRRMLVLVPTDTPMASFQRDKIDVTNPSDTLVRQYVSLHSLRPRTITGSAKLVVPAYQGSPDTDAWLQLMIRVVSANGGTVRGNLFSGQVQLAESSSPVAPNYEIAIAPADTRALAVTLDPVTPQAGDRLVVEIGYRSTATTAGRQTNFYFGDEADAVASDYSGAVGQALDSNKRPWIEFSSDIFVLTPVSRFYFPSNGSVPLSPAVSSGWEAIIGVPTTPLRLPLAPSPTNTIQVSDNSLPPAVTAPDTLHRQFISGPLSAGSIFGQFTMVIAGSVNGSTMDTYLQTIIRVVSADGTVVRGTLYSGQTFSATSAVPTDPNYRFYSPLANNSVAGTKSRVLTAQMSPVTAQIGDRLVVEVGGRAFSPNGTSRALSMVIGDPSAVADFPQSVDNDGATGRPWIEFAPGLKLVPYVATRLYLPAAGTPGASPAFDSSWEVTFEADRRPMVLTPSNTTQVGLSRTKNVATAPADVLGRQFVSDALLAQRISGAAKLVVAGASSSTATHAFLQMVVRVVSADGSVVRGTLYSGQSASTESVVSTDPNYEYIVAPTNQTRVLDVTLTPVTVLTGDRLVVEIGTRHNNTDTTRSTSMYFQDKSTDGDFSGTVGEALGTTLRPWIEFEKGIVFA